MVSLDLGSVFTVAIYVLSQEASVLGQDYHQDTRPGLHGRKFKVQRLAQDGSHPRHRHLWAISAPQSHTQCREGPPRRIASLTVYTADIKSSALVVTRLCLSAMTRIVFCLRLCPLYSLVWSNSQQIVCTNILAHTLMKGVQEYLSAADSKLNLPVILYCLYAYNASFTEQ